MQTYIVQHGLDMIRKYEAVAGPVILITMAALATWIFTKAGSSIAWSTDHPLTGAAMWREIFAGGALWVSIYATFVLNFCDFTRNSKTRKSIIKGNFWGIPINTVFFGVIVIVMAGAQFKIDGVVIESPADIVHAIPNTFLLVAASLALLVLTIAVNLMANFVAPIYALTNLFPKKLNFRPRRPCQRRHRPGHPALEPVQQPGGDRLLPRRTGCTARPPVRRHHRRLLAAATHQDQCPRAVTPRTPPGRTTTATASTHGPSPRSSPPRSSRY